MRTKKTVIHSFFAWDYAREAAHLDEMSRKGWQLQCEGLFSARYVRDERVCYRHQIDYRRKDEIDNMGHYIETFAEQGWEYINSLQNGWHFFRKRYDPALPEEEYRIYTDTASLTEMRCRWARGFGLIALCLLAVDAMSWLRFFLCPCLPRLLYAATFLLEVCIMGLGWLRMKHGRGERRFWPAKDGPLLLMLIMLVGFGGYFCLDALRPNSSWMTADELGALPASVEESMYWLDLDIRYRDWYYLSLETRLAQPMTLTLLSEDGQVVFTQRLEAGDTREEVIDRQRLTLKPGTYRLYLSDFAGGAAEVYLDID